MGILLFGTKVKTFYTRNWASHHTIEAGLVVELYACSKIKIARGRGIPNSVTPQRKIDKFSKTMLNITEPKTKNSACLLMPQYQNSRPQLDKYRTKIWQTPQYCKISQCKELKIKNPTILSPPRGRRLIPNTRPHCSLLQALSAELRVLRFPVECISVSKKYRILGSFHIRGCFLFTCRYLLFRFVIDNLFCGYEVRHKQNFR